MGSQSFGSPQGHTPPGHTLGVSMMIKVRKSMKAHHPELILNLIDKLHAKRRLAPIRDACYRFGYGLLACGHKRNQNEIKDKKREEIKII